MDFPTVKIIHKLTSRRIYSCWAILINEMLINLIEHVQVKLSQTILVSFWQYYKKHSLYITSAGFIEAFYLLFIDNCRSTRLNTLLTAYIRKYITFNLTFLEFDKHNKRQTAFYTLYSFTVVCLKMLMKLINWLIFGLHKVHVILNHALAHANVITIIVWKALFCVWNKVLFLCLTFFQLISGQYPE